MEPYGAYESIFFITVSGIELAIVLNVVEHAITKQQLRYYLSDLAIIGEFLIILYILSKYLDLSDFRLGYLVYSSLVCIYKLLSNPYHYYLLCLTVFSISYILHEITTLSYYKKYFRFVSSILLICYFIAWPTFSNYLSIPSALIPFSYFYLLSSKFYSEQLEISSQKFITNGVLIMIGYYTFIKIDHERFLIFTTEIGFVLALISLFFLILPDIYPYLSNNRSPRSCKINRNISNYADLIIAICLLGSFLSLLLAESVLGVIYSRVPTTYYFIIAYGYSSILEIAYSLYHNEQHLKQGKYQFSFMVQLVAMKYIWVLFS